MIQTVGVIPQIIVLLLPAFQSLPQCYGDERHLLGFVPVIKAAVLVTTGACYFKDVLNENLICLHCISFFKPLPARDRGMLLCHLGKERRILLNPVSRHFYVFLI